MSETIMAKDYTENRKVRNSEFPECVIYGPEPIVHPIMVLTTRELIARLNERGIKNADIARALGVTPSRITEMKKGERAIKLDEAAKLVAAFDLESGSDQPVPSIPAPVGRLVVEHIALQLGVRLEGQEALLDALAEDLRAFAEFVTDPKVRGSIDLAMAFFRAMRLRQPTSQEADPPGNHPENAH